MTQRRSSHIHVPATYASVGASSAPDLMKYPPAGTTPFEDELRLGSGQDRFMIASSALMTWAAVRGAGYTVDQIVVGDGGSYTGLEFDPAGTPIAPGAAEENFGPDGEPFITAGTTARIGYEAGKLTRAIRIVYVVNEPRRIGLAIGSMDELGTVGESRYCVEHRADDSVWATVRGFLIAPEAGLLGLKGRAELKKSVESAREQLRALLPTATAEADPASTSGDDVSETDVSSTDASDTDASGAAN